MVAARHSKYKGPVNLSHHGRRISTAAKDMRQHGFSISVGRRKRSSVAHSCASSLYFLKKTLLMFQMQNHVHTELKQSKSRHRIKMKSG